MTGLNESMNDNSRLNSFEKFEQRLKTFKIFKWFAKPIEFSPIECAKRGWINLTKDTLKCVVCSNLFYYYTKTPNRVHFNSVSNNDKTTTMDNLHNPKLLIEKHNVNCPYKTLSIPDSLIEVNIFNEENLNETFLEIKETYKKCQQLPYLIASTYEQFYATDLNSSLTTVSNNNGSPSIALKIDLKEKLKTVNILAVCGWFYKDDKDVLNCTKCFRSVGLWMYNKRAQFDEDDDEYNNNDETMNTTEHNISDSANLNNLSDFFMFHTTDPYSDEQSVKSCLSKIINIIEIEEQSQLKNNISYFHSNKKRKLDQMLTDGGSSSARPSASASGGITETNKKVFDPIHEHFSWCPWIRKHLKTEKLICQLNFEIVNKFMLKTNQKQTDVNSFNLPDMNTYLLNRSKSTTNTDDVVVNSQLLLDKVKSAQSILINSTSNFSFKC